jgi:hypothetical protein
MTINLPDIAAPKPVAEASEALRTAEQRLGEVRRERQSREAGVKEAEALDREDLARRLTADPEAKPKREHRDRAEAEVAEAVEIEQALTSNVEAAIERAASVTLEHVTKWAAAVEEARTKADATFERAVAKLRDAECARSELRGVAAWLKQLEAGGALFLKGGGGGTVKPSRGAMPIPGKLDARDARNADSKLSVEYALELLSAYAHQSSVEGEREAEQRRIEAERKAEERRAQIAAARGGMPA